MAYLGNDLQVAYQSYQIIDDISSSFNGVLTTFPLQVGGVTPVPFPINPQQCLISVNGVIQEPDPSGTNGFKFSGGNIVFSSAPNTGEDFFGVILAGADYVNVGVNYPSGSESAPSITFDTSLDTGIYSPSVNQFAITTAGVERVNFKGSTEVVFNDGGNDVDFRVEGDTKADLFKVDAGTNAVSIDGAFSVTGDTTVSSLNGGPLAGTRNRIINGDMRIDQRNAGASVTPTGTGTYLLDRWAALLSVSSKFSVQQNAGSVTPPAGFKYYAGITSLSAYTVGAAEIFSLRQIIEGYNIADLDWGTANAKAVVLSFWVRSSLTGTFGGAISSPANNYSYPFTYTISAANTWEQKTVLITGPTAGTWNSTNNFGIAIIFNLGAGATYSGTAGSWAASDLYSATGATSVVGTNGATFYITGVQLEPGTVATPFERRSYGQELALCQRYYYQTSYPYDFYGRAGTVSNTTYHPIIHEFPVPMRIAPNFDGTGATFTAVNSSAFSNATTTRRHVTVISLSNTPNLDAYYILSTGSLTWTAEL